MQFSNTSKVYWVSYSKNTLYTGVMQFTWPLNKITPKKLKFLTPRPPPPPPPSKDFSEIFNWPLPQAGGGVHALKAQLRLSPLIQNRVQEDYLPE